MDLQKLLDYQKVDMIIYKAENEYLGSDKVARLNSLKKSIKTAEANLLKLDQEAGETMEIIKKLDDEIHTLMQEKNTLGDKAETLERIESSEKSLNNYLELLGNIEKEAKEAFSKLDSITKEAGMNYEKGKKFAVDLKACNEEVKLLQQDMQVKYKAQYDERKALLAEIDPAIIEKYNLRRNERKMPCLVAYNDGNCSACGMDIRIEVEEKLKNPGDVAECPSCRRIVYRK